MSASHMHSAKTPALDMSPSRSKLEETPAPEPFESPRDICWEQERLGPRCSDARLVAWLRGRLLEERRLLELRHGQLCKEMLQQLGSTEGDFDELLAQAEASEGVARPEAVAVEGAVVVRTEVLGERELPRPPDPSSGAADELPSGTSSGLIKLPPKLQIKKIQAADVKKSAGAAKQQLSVHTKSIRHGEVLTVENKYVRIIDGFYFESFFGVVIFANVVVMALEAQYIGINMGRAIGFSDANTTPYHKALLWPGGDYLFSALEVMFGIIFILEVATKIVVLRHRFVSCWWNSFDVFIVVFWVLAQVGHFTTLNPTVFRVCRLVKLCRVIRLVKVTTVADHLVLMVSTVNASIGVLFWGVVLLVGAMTIAALMLQSLLADFMSTKSADVDLSARHAVYNLFGTFTRSMITMFEITLASWVGPCRILVDNVSDYYAIFILLYKCVVGFAVVKVISGVFLHETFRTASLDDDLLVQTRRRMRSRFKEKMHAFFAEADVGEDGDDDLVSCQEFADMIAHDRVNTWLEAMDLRIRDVGADRVYAYLAGSDHQLTRDELCSGMARLRGTAQGLDVLTLIEIASPEIRLPPSRDTKRLMPSQIK